MTKCHGSGFTSPATPVARSAWPSNRGSPHRARHFHLHQGTYDGMDRETLEIRGQGAEGVSRIGKSMRTRSLWVGKPITLGNAKNGSSIRQFDLIFELPSEVLRHHMEHGGPVIGAIEDRFARIEAVLTGRRAGVSPTGGQGRGRMRCFNRLPEGPGPNPVAAPPYFLTVLDHSVGHLCRALRSSLGALLDSSCWMDSEIKIDGECPVVQATLVHLHARRRWRRSTPMAPSQVRRR